MLKLLFIGLFPFFNVISNWETNFDVAKEKAVKENKIMLVHFYKNDKKGSANHFQTALFENDTFVSYANRHLILLQVDLSIKTNNDTEQQFIYNSIILERYNPKGIYPYTVILESSGKLLTSWEHSRQLSSSKLVADIQSSIEANKQ
jgi:hypothetical protein